ncbi:MAG: hypothetical protein ABDH37_00830 [Candidatus Hydrothermales bacterium]
MKDIIIKAKYFILILFFLSLCTNKKSEIERIEKELNFLKVKIHRIENKVDSLIKDLEEFKKNIEIRLAILKSSKRENPKEFKHPWDKSCNKCH